LSALRDLDRLRPLYTVPGDDLIGEVLVPAMASCSSVRCMAGFFHSSAFRHLAPGLAAFVNGTAGAFRLLISPALDDADRAALRSASTDPDEVLARAALTILKEAGLSASALEQHTLDCLGYLLAAGRLFIRFVLMPDGGMFHPKVWLFKSDADVVAAHGSSNATTAGLLFNFEAVSIDRSWSGPEALERVVALEGVFERLWQGHEPSTLTIDLPTGLDLATPLGLSDRPPTIDDFWRAWHVDAAAGLAPPLPAGHQLPAVNPVFFGDEALAIPAGLQWQSGPFSHQGRAVAAWEAAGGKGLLSMATGSGKTVTSLICAARLQDTAAPLLVVVAAPYRPLVEQWADEVRDFGVEPANLARLDGRERARVVRDAVMRLERKVSRVEAIVMTHEFLLSDAFDGLLADVPDGLATLLIADEVHNLGRPRFLARPPERFDHRLGLSATPVLQYNEEGTQAIADFFGETVFEFSLKDAIGVCLVPYNYYLHPVELAPDEEQQWDELTEKLIRAGFRGSDDGKSEGTLSAEVVALLVKRRAVLEGAAAKVSALVAEMKSGGLDEVRHTLVYCSDKRPEQLIAVNRALMDEGMFVRQITAEETVDRRRTSEILDDFALGDYQVITCKRVLDEGVDLPQVRTAYLLASSTVRRQWIQRRGRILRRCDAVGKRLAHLHDFLVVPSEPESPSGGAILRQELERARAFAELSANAGGPTGPFATMEQIVHGGDS
jgi:superfamily II DNA or RNA helicase